MKYINAMVVIFCTVTFFFVFLSGIKLCLKLDDEFNSVIESQSAEKFIAESFRNTCKGNGFEDLNQWQINCREMFNLDYIAWSNANEFMDVSMKNTNSELFYGVWKKNGNQKEVYCRMKRKWQ